MIVLSDKTPVPRKVRAKVWGRVRVTLNYDYTDTRRAFAIGFRLLPAVPVISQKWTYTVKFDGQDVTAAVDAIRFARETA